MPHASYLSFNLFQLEVGEIEGKEVLVVKVRKKIEYGYII